MVNDGFSTKYKILEILRNAKRPFSGEYIAWETGVSRVAVWKTIRSLQTAGYEISASKNGYSLVLDQPDSLYPWEFGGDERFFAHFAKIDSTMTEARRIAETQELAGKIQTQIVTADKQTNGRGQSRRSWRTTEGSLACTVITRNKISAAAAHRITMGAQIAIVKTLRKYSDRAFYVRWPNDVWSGKGKTGGVLTEVFASGNQCSRINVGIGVNVYKKPNIPLSDCVFKNEKPLIRKALLASFRSEFKQTQRLAKEGSGELSAEWNALCRDAELGTKFTYGGKTVYFDKINGWGWGVFIYPGTKETILLPPGETNVSKT